MFMAPTLVGTFSDSIALVLRNICTLLETIRPTSVGNLCFCQTKTDIGKSIKQELFDSKTSSL
jgi:hypothetical protein